MESRSQNLQTRKSFVPTVGEKYTNEGGGEFVCESVFLEEETARFTNTQTGWSLLAHGIGKYDNGTIDWDFSTYSYFKNGAEKVKSETETNEKRLFVDMDGTIARFHSNVNYLEQMYEKDFFRELEPFACAVEALKVMHEQNPDTEIFILSATIDGEPPYSKLEKTAWLKEYLPFIDNWHIIFTPVGENKCDYIPDGINSNDVLWDDYNKNLEEWQQAGGTAVKCKNDINHKGLVGPLWEGKLVENTITPVEIAEDITNILTGRTDISYRGQLKIEDRIIHSRILTSEEMANASFVQTNLEGIRQCQLMERKLANAGLVKDIKGQIDFHFEQIAEAIKSAEMNKRVDTENKLIEKEKEHSEYIREHSDKDYDGIPDYIDSKYTGQTSEKYINDEASESQNKTLYLKVTQKQLNAIENSGISFRKGKADNHNETIIQFEKSQFEQIQKVLKSDKGIKR